MRHINASKNTVVKSTPETFELIKALFKANGVNTNYTDAVYADAGSVHVGSDIDGDFCAGKNHKRDVEITIQELAFESLPAPEWATMIVKCPRGSFYWISDRESVDNSLAKRVTPGSVETVGVALGWRLKSTIVLQKQPATTNKPQPTHYRKISNMEPWEVVKRWQESDDLYVEHTICGFAKIRHLQQLAQLIHQDKVYEQVSERVVCIAKLSELADLSNDAAEALYDGWLRFINQP